MTYAVDRNVIIKFVSGKNRDCQVLNRKYLMTAGTLAPAHLPSCLRDGMHPVTDGAQSRKCACLFINERVLLTLFGEY